MRFRKHIDKISVACIALAVIITIWFMNGERFGIEAIVDEDAEMYSDSIYFSTNDLRPNWDTSQATRITLNGTDADISGSGAYAYDGDVVIGMAGDYVISGTLSDGSVIVEADNSAKIWIQLDGVDIYCSDDAAFRVNQADKVFLTPADGSENKIASGEEYSKDAQDKGANGALFTHDDLTINGSGSLSVEAAYKHGIDANDDLVLTGGSVVVKAPQDAIHVNDSIRIREASVSATGGDDGLVVAKDDGYFYMESGMVMVGCEDDGIHTAGDVTIEGGELSIAAGDDGIHSDTAIGISDGSILIAESYEGLEALTIDISGGEMEIHATDDGLNANGGSGDFGGGPPGGGFHEREDGESGDSDESGEAADGAESEHDTPENGDMAPPEMPDETENESGDDDEETWVHISGGSITVVNESGRDADGIDSNGDIDISGGTVRLSLVNDGGNNALDCGSENGGIIVINGGDVVTCGSSGMVETISDTSQQCSILYVSEEEIPGETEITLTDENGNTLLSYDVPYSFSAVHLSCPDLRQGETYHLEMGGVADDITIESVATTVGMDENGGGMHGPGMGGRGGGNRDGGGWNHDGDGGGEHRGPGGEDADGEHRGGFGAFTPSQVDRENMMPPDERQDAAEEEEDAVVDTRVDIRDLGADTWVRLSAVGAALVFGFVFVLLWI